MLCETRTHVRKRLDEIVDVGGFRGLHDLLHSRGVGVVAVSNIVGDGPIEKNGFLRNDAQLPPQPRYVQCLAVRVVQGLKFQCILGKKQQDGNVDENPLAKHSTKTKYICVSHKELCCNFGSNHIRLTAIKWSDPAST